MEFVSIDDGFWNGWLETNRNGTIDYQYEQLESSGTLENFRRVGAGERGDHNGQVFQDSDAYKWLEAASYVLSTHFDPELEARAEEVIDLVATAQAESGYLNTYFQLEEPDKRWTNIHEMHELYCAGHLIEAAVAHHRATGNRNLLDVAVALANHVDGVFGSEIDAPPGHQEIELALVKLARVTDESRYLELAEYFLNRRGHTDRFEWELEHLEEIGGEENQNLRPLFFEDGEYDGKYAQAHAPLREQEQVEGHAVRAMYFLAAATDIAMETDNAALIDHLKDLWEAMTTRRMYITGGIGSDSRNEGFTTDYDLPNETAYAETCAAIGSIFWNQRLFRLTGAAKYHDLIERQLYNAVLVGVSMDGQRYFYDNVLESDGSHTRQDWFECACCPPNVARLFASLGKYLYAVGEDALYVNQYAGSEASTTVAGTTVDIEQRTAYPWEGTVSIDVAPVEPTAFALKIRIPSWCEDATVRVDGEEIETPESGYATIERTWTESTVVAEFEQTVTVQTAHPDVAATAGKVALQRGPLVYCLEGHDNPAPPHQYRIDPTDTFSVTTRPDLLDGVETITGDGTTPARGGWNDRLYRPATDTDREQTSFTAIPYFAWANREPAPMRVWQQESA
jgi:DUF1680 family protein